MARKTTIGKDVILEAALQMLIADGYESINIRTLAEKIGCSSQPLVWHFENMEGLRKALAVYAREYAVAKANPGKREGAAAFEFMGRAYIKMAMKEPNLFKFLYLGGCPLDKPLSLNDISSEADSEAMIGSISAQTGLAPDKVIKVIQDTIMYSHGIATMIATGVFNAPEKQVMALIKSASEAFVLQQKAGSNG
ncbi:MAG: TetR/AcrR family transcriptional regulator [Saccharofermentans sp.]|nr:TetR/AcrR family transcriptional regulator [Saccharofermentans sp.]